MDGFKSKNLSVLAYANGFTLWHYTTPDTPDDLVGQGEVSKYFDGAAHMLRVGDMILANCQNAGEPTAAILLVSASDGEVSADVTCLTDTSAAPTNP